MLLHKLCRSKTRTCIQVDTSPCFIQSSMISGIIPAPNLKPFRKINRSCFLRQTNIGNIVITATDIVQFLHHMHPSPKRRKTEKEKEENRKKQRKLRRKREGISFDFFQLILPFLSQKEEKREEIRGFSFLSHSSSLSQRKKKNGKNSIQK